MANTAGKVELRSCNNPPQSRPYILHLSFSRLQKIVVCFQPYIAVPSCIFGFWRGVIPTKVLNPRRGFHIAHANLTT